MAAKTNTDTECIHRIIYPSCFASFEFIRSVNRLSTHPAVFSVLRFSLRRLCPREGYLYMTPHVERRPFTRGSNPYKHTRQTPIHTKYNAKNSTLIRLLTLFEQQKSSHTTVVPSGMSAITWAQFYVRVSRHIWCCFCF